MEHFKQVAYLLNFLLFNCRKLKITGAGIVLLVCSFVYDAWSWPIIIISFCSGFMSACEIIDLLADCVFDEEDK